jgi:hypothetical protein
MRSDNTKKRLSQLWCECVLRIIENESPKLRYRVGQDTTNIDSVDSYLVLFVGE